MRKPEYLSPSGMQRWNDGVEAFYLRYLTDFRPPDEPQTKPMAVGSAFDAYCKSFLHEKLFGKNHSDSNQFDFASIFEAQVEKHNRDWVLKEGAYCFAVYKECGALMDLLGELQKAQNSPRFEFEVRGQVNGFRDGVYETMNGVTLLGKPDAYYVNSYGTHVVLDWKVNGYCSNSPTSPMQGYVRCRDMFGKNSGMHKNCSPFELGTMTINIGGYLEHFKKDWARQLSIYAWLLGQPVGSDYVVAIDQLSCKPSYPGQRPSIRVAEHRLRVSKSFQWEIFQLACEIWEIIHSGWVFRQMSREDSIERCALLDQQAEVLYGGHTEEDAIFLEMTRR